MTAKLLLALALVVAPLGAAAEGCNDRIRFECPDGQHWDATTKSCVLPSS